MRNLARLAVAAILLLSTGSAGARDDGRYAGSPLKQWFDSLKSGKGPCCDGSDATKALCVVGATVYAALMETPSYRGVDHFENRFDLPTSDRFEIRQRILTGVLGMHSAIEHQSVAADL